MNPKFACSLLACLGLLQPAAAQGTRMLFGPLETRTFESDECLYTLPGDDWRWGDPPAVAKGVKGLVSARNQSGMSFLLMVATVNFELDSKAYADFEGGLLSTSGLKKVYSRHISFKGVPGYQIDLESPDGSRGGAVRALFANDRAYCLMVLSQRSVPSQAEAEAAFDKFDFTETPRPMKPPPESRDDQAAGRLSAWPITPAIVVAAMAVAILLGVWWVLNTRNNM